MDYNENTEHGDGVVKYQLPRPDCGWVLGWCWELEAGGWWIMERQSWCQCWRNFSTTPEFQRHPSKNY
ncbi:hypothetical protein PoB_006004800 [Plakobranchus ocellatus]|uniref:Uncharacterized protein n=1 Tax=Plakobranchus ocellatus TaxID=259542 RepID=A0AAV4CNV6_9GAST|nr:hypothetical protein PoB_006004800 [Plakobranchus ocellatus]